MNRKNLIIGFFTSAFIVLTFNSSSFAEQGCGTWIDNGFFEYRNCSFDLIPGCTTNFRCSRIPGETGVGECMITSTTGPGCLGITDGANTGPGTVDEFLFQGAHADGGDYIQPVCRFSCTGTGSFCPATDPLVFQEISQPGQLLRCENLNFTAGLYGCGLLANQTCQQTTYHASDTASSGKVDINGELPPPSPWIDPNPRGETVYQSFWWIPNQNANGFQNQQFDPIQLTDPTIHFESIIGPQGETLDSVQYFNNMAVQQLIDKNNSASKTEAPLKK